MSLEDLPSGWEVWNEEPGGQVILAYRPDVFDTRSFHPACMPTIAIDRGVGPNQAPERRLRSESWYVAFYLEPLVRVRRCDEVFESRDGALEGATEVAGRFAAGEIDYREAYQVPRDDYLTELDALVGP
jgi:hypothetical protein